MKNIKASSHDAIPLSYYPENLQIIGFERSKKTTNRIAFFSRSFFIINCTSDRARKLTRLKVIVKVKPLLVCYLLRNRRFTNHLDKTLGRLPFRM